MDDTAAMEWMLDKLKDYKTNAEFFESMKRKQSYQSFCFSFLLEKNNLSITPIKKTPDNVPRTIKEIISSVFKVIFLSKTRTSFAGMRSYDPLVNKTIKRVEKIRIKNNLAFI